jgi:glyoxylase-like metal-dependent hydrolase (beta-lactamase superfamily II)
VLITKEVFPNIFQIQVPLPHNPLGHLNSYLIKSAKKNLLIDTGLNFPESFQALCKGLSDAGLKPEELTEILLTHFHVDHVGLIPRFKEASRNIELSIHRVEAELSKLMLREFGNYRKKMKTFLEANGAPSAIVINLERFHPAFFTPEAYRELAVAAVPVEDGQEMSIGDYNLQVLWTPGHSPGHICLYEPSLRALFSGDHLLPTITSHIAQFMENMNPLTDYLNSLEKTERLDVKVVLPAHEETFTNHQERTRQLKEHHRQRLMEIVDELRTDSSTAYALTSRMHWNVRYKSWEEFPLFEKYLALGETVAHLNFLEQRGLVRRTEVNQTTFYSIDQAGNETEEGLTDLS